MSMSIEYVLSSTTHEYYLISNTQLQIKRLVDTEIISIRLFNALGQSLNAWDSDLENRNLSLEVNNMTVGMYIVQLETTDGDIVKKMLVE